MKLYNVGRALYDYRAYYKLSQNQLCKGICSASTLSRIESGEREIDSLLAETLFSRVGKTIDLFEFILNEEDYWLGEIREKIKNKIENKQLKQAEYLLNKYETYMPKNQKLHKQFLFFYRAMILKLSHGLRKEIIMLLHQAINLTRSDYRDALSLKLYSTMEIKVFFELLFYENLEDFLLRQLSKFMEDYYDTEKKEKYMIPFLYHLTVQYEREKKYREMVHVSQKAIEILSVGNSYSYMADFYFQKLIGEEKIYSYTDTWDGKRKQLIEECHHVFYMYMVDGKYGKMSQMERFCKEKLQCQIIR